jgi:hypothetical protein
MYTSPTNKKNWQCLQQCIEAKKKKPGARGESYPPHAKKNWQCIQCIEAKKKKPGARGASYPPHAKQNWQCIQCIQAKKKNLELEERHTRRMHTHNTSVDVRRGAVGSCTFCVSIWTFVLEKQSTLTSGDVRLAAAPSASVFGPLY